MNVASLELCHGLFELSGWYPVLSKCRGYYWTDVSPIGQLCEWYIEHSFGPRSPEHLVPAYDLGYLLRKLPQGAHIIKQANGYAASSSANVHTKYTRGYETAETAEDAAAKLAITLIKNGVINKE